MDAEVIELSSSSELSDVEDDVVEEVAASQQFTSLPIRRRLLRRSQQQVTNHSESPTRSSYPPSTEVESIDSDHEDNDDDDDDDDDLEIVEFRKKTESLISQKHQQQVEKLNQVTCPICFEPPNFPTVTSCGHLFCLECIKQSISSSAARGQVSSGSKGTGLCPLCRKRVIFRETVVLRLCIKGVSEVPPLPS